MTSPRAGAEMIDWELAVATATKLVRPGPEVSREEARAAVAELRAHAAEAERHVREYTGLNSPNGGTPVLVVDRPGWIRANVAGFRTVIGPLADRMAATVPAGSGRTSRASAPSSARSPTGWRPAGRTPRAAMR